MTRATPTADEAWLKRECEEAEREIAKWPEWMQIAAQFEPRIVKPRKVKP